MKMLFWRGKKRAPRRIGPVLAHYARPSHWQRHRVRWMSALLFFTWFYGAAFGLTTTFFLLQLSVPLIILAAAAIWLLPESEAAPVGLLTTILFTYLTVLLLWPDYLAVALPGLPWITAVRLVGVPLGFVLMVCLSTSAALREQFKQILGATPLIWRLMAGFGLLATLSVAVSGDVGLSISKLIVAGLNWFLIFFVAAFVFSQPGKLMRLAYLLWVCVLILSMIGIQEWRHSVVPWAGHIPSFLAIQDDAVLRILSGASRAGSGIYRVQSKFTTSLGLAEFYALTVPFILHFAFNAPRWWLRVAAVLTVPLIFRMIILTDSRLGVVGFFSACLLYLLIGSVWRWQRSRDSAFGPLIVVAYPAIFCGFVAATFFVRRLNAMVWGSGAQQASTESRKLQYIMGFPKVVARPWGYGIGRGAEALGFYNGAGVLTIDTYYLAVALEFGVAGFIVYYSMFVVGAWNGARRIIAATDPEHMLVAPITIALVNFIIIKSIFSQLENHALVFALLGALVAICYRIDANKRPAA